MAKALEVRASTRVSYRREAAASAAATAPLNLSGGTSPPSSHLPLAGRRLVRWALRDVERTRSERLSESDAQPSRWLPDNEKLVASPSGPNTATNWIVNNQSGLTRTRDRQFLPQRLHLSKQRGRREPSRSGPQRDRSLR
jgi:hypothetical protein